MDQQPVQGDVAPPEEFRGFNHEWNLQLCIARCINSANNPLDYIAAVNQLEATLISETDSETMKNLTNLETQAHAQLGVQSNRVDIQFSVAREKYRILYAFMKKRAPVKAVLAIGRPKCHKCGELIRWDRTVKEEKEET